MMAVNQISNTSINRVYSTFVGGVLATSIIIMGNGAITLGHNSDCLGQIVNHFNEKTNIDTSFASKSCISFNVPGYSNNKSVISGVDQVTVNEEKLQNIKKLL